VQTNGIGKVPSRTTPQNTFIYVWGQFLGHNFRNILSYGIKIISPSSPKYSASNKSSFLCKLMVLGKFRREQRPKTCLLVFDGDSSAPPPPPQWSPPRPRLLHPPGSRNGHCWCSGDVVFQDWSGAPSASFVVRGWWCRDTGGAYYEAHAVVRWFMTSRSVLPTLSRGLLVLWGWWEFSISPDIWRLTYYLVVITNSKIFSPDVTPGFASTRSRDTQLGT